MGQKQSSNVQEVERENDVNIALVGASGSGKSSFINAVRGLDDDDDLAVKTGVSEEETASESNPISYSHPEKSHIKFCNLPGLGTPTYPDVKSYCEKLNLKTKFDAFLIFTSGRFSMNDLVLAKQLEAMNKPFFMIRTKIDVDLKNECKKKTFNEDKMLNQIRDDILESVKDLHCSGEEVFLISNHERENWDFQRLNGELLSREFSPRQTTGCVGKPQFTSMHVENDKRYDIDNDSKESMLNHLKKHLHEAKCAIEEMGINAAQKLMEERLKSWQKVEITLAITGTAGSGKSSFINAIRGLKDDVEGLSAPTGITETTMYPTEYHYPSNEKITLWDLPGIGTPTFPNLKTYCNKVNIAKYDAFIIMSSDRFTETDAQLAKKLASINKPFLFVRSKIDQPYDNEVKKKGFDEEAMLMKIRMNCSDNFDKLKILTFDNKNIFLVSKDHPQKYDFPRLTEAISNQLPLAKQVSFNLSMYILSEDVLKRKVRTLRGRIWLVACRSILVTCITKKSYSRKVNFDYISEYVEFYESQLGLPDKESEEFQGMTEELQKAVQRVTTDWLKQFDGGFGSDEVECSNEADAIENPYSFVYRSLNRVLDEMRDVALAILKDADRKMKELNKDSEDIE